MWNVDFSEDIYIDLTADQFDSNLPGVYITNYTDPNYNKGRF